MKEKSRGKKIKKIREIDFKKLRTLSLNLIVTRASFIMPLPYKAVFTPTKQGGRHLTDRDNYVYVQAKKRPLKTWYSCIEKKALFCPATAVVKNEDDMIIQLSGNHTHDSNLMKRKVKDIEKSVITATSGNYHKIIIGDITSRVVSNCPGKHN